MRDNKHSCRLGDGGYTIIEVLIALTLLVAAMIPLAIILSTGLRTSVANQTRIHAKELASTEIDEVKGMSYSAIGLAGVSTTIEEATNGQQIGPEAGYSGLEAGPETVQTPSGNTYEVTRDVRKYVNSSMSNDAATKQVTITVSWTGPGPASSETVSTVIGPTDTAD